jgi:hypothetical protein
MNSKNIRDLYRRINEFNRTYQPRNNLEEGNGDLLADSHILNSWKNYAQLLNMHTISGVRWIEIHTAQLLAPDASPFDVKITSAKLKSINYQVVIKF